MPGIETKSVSSRNCFSVGSCVRASATGPSGDFAASIRAMQSPSVASGANVAHAERSASWLRRRSARPRASSSASEVVTASVAASMRAKRSAPSAKPCVADGSLPLEPRGLVRHGRRGGLDNGIELCLQRGVGDGGEGRLDVAPVVLREAVETRDAIFDEGERHRRSHVLAHLCQRRGDGSCVSNERAQPGGRVGVWACDVDVRVEAVVEVPDEIGVRLVGVLEPEQLATRHVHEIVTLEAVRCRQLGRVERGRAIDGRFQKVDSAA